MAQMNGPAKTFRHHIRRLIVITLLVSASALSIYLMKIPGTRSYGIGLFILSFAWLYAYIVKRRTTVKK